MLIYALLQASKLILIRVVHQRRLKSPLVVLGIVTMLHETLGSLQQFGNKDSRLLLFLSAGTCP